ncbi:HEWD family protein [Halostella litorea]|uniref:HEWD family protein n=1 Tax=Halostella litorea TaxID=2528831 RepID=UPI00109190E5|nr:HEWD family protein [Halostella litorea]
MGTALRTPSRRKCERCGRSERWDEDAETWRIRVEDGERLVGNPHCIHEWDITGSFTPIE